MTQDKNAKIKVTKDKVRTIKKRRSTRKKAKRKVKRVYNYYLIGVYVTAAAACIFFIAFRAINISIERQLKVQLPEKKMPVHVLEAPEEKAPEIIEESDQIETRENAHISEPGEYRIRVQERDLLTPSEYNWNTQTRKAVNESDIVEKMSESGSFDGMKKTPEQYEQQLERINKRIEEFEQKIQDDPGDNYARQKLQGLYMLKATVKSLKQAIIDK